MESSTSNIVSTPRIRAATRPSSHSINSSSANSRKRWRERDYTLPHHPRPPPHHSLRLHPFRLLHISILLFKMQLPNQINNLLRHCLRSRSPEPLVKSWDSDGSQRTTKTSLQRHRMSQNQTSWPNYPLDCRSTNHNPRYIVETRIPRCDQMPLGPVVLPILLLVNRDRLIEQTPLHLPSPWSPGVIPISQPFLACLQCLPSPLSPPSQNMAPVANMPTNYEMEISREA